MTTGVPFSPAALAFSMFRVLRGWYERSVEMLSYAGKRVRPGQFTTLVSSPLRKPRRLQVSELREGCLRDNSPASHLRFELLPCSFQYVSLVDFETWIKRENGVCYSEKSAATFDSTSQRNKDL